MNGRPPMRFGGFLSIAAVSVLVVSAKANLGKDRPDLTARVVATPVATPMPTRTIYRTVAPSPVATSGASQRPLVGETAEPSQPVRPTLSAHRRLVGTRIATDFGPVQVALLMTGGHIDDVVALAVPDGDPQSADISRTSIPQLREEVLHAQSADIQGVSGATYTAQGYALSVQSALDQL